MKLFHSLLLTTILLFSTSAMSAQTQAEKININTASAEQIAKVSVRFIMVYPPVFPLDSPR